MDKNTKVNLVEKKLNSLETMLKNNESITTADISAVSNMYKLVENDSNILDDVKSSLKSRIDDLSKLAIKETKTSVSNLKVRKAAVILAGSIALASTALVTAYSLQGCATQKQAEVVEQPNIPVEKDIEIPETTVEEPQTVETKEKVLPADWSFDPNDNGELVNRMAEFIADALTKGVAVKDVMNADEIELAQQNDQSLLTIEQLMDFYFVMNIEDIDPMDYARLCYNTKTAETITDNYMYCARMFMEDSLTATELDTINYETIIADKESSEALQEFVNLLASYNSNTVSAEEIKDFIIDTYIEKDANLYSMSVNEMTYRLMFDADMISNNAIIPKDVNIILNEDGKIGCGIEKEDGVKNKTEKAEEFTSIYNTVAEKLEISREFINQDTTGLVAGELKTGVELEELIRIEVLKKNVRFNLNEKFKGTDVKVSAKKGGNSTNYVSGISPSTGKQVNVSATEMAKYGATTLAEYEANKKAAFEAAAKADPNHVIKDNSGNVVASGTQVDTAQYNAGYSAGYFDGNNKKASNPGSSNASYVGGYNAGYAQGLSDRNALDASYQKQSSQTFVDVSDQVVEHSETIVEQPYTEPITPIAPTPEVQPEPQPEPQASEPITEFVPVDEMVDSSSEDIQIFDYTSSIKDLLKDYKNAILKASNRMVADNNKTHKM